MQTVIICDDGFSIYVEKEPEGPQLVVRQLPGQELAAKFPTDLSLLRGVISGYSYQVASTTGSLSITAEGETVLFKLDLDSAASTRCRSTFSRYEAAMDSLQAG